LTAFRIALDLTQAKLGRIGISVYIRQLHEALAPLLGDRLVPIASRLARPVAGARRTVGERLATLGRDLWWHQLGVTRAARRRGCRLLHLPAGLGPIRGAFPAVVTVHDIMPLRFPQLFRPWYRNYVRVVLPRLAQRACAVISPSATVKREIEEWLGVPAERVTVIPHGVDPVFRPLVADDARASAVRRRYSLPPNFALAVGSIEPRKNLPRLIEALEMLRGRPGSADIFLVHAGPEGWRPEAATSSVVRFLGYVPTEDLATIYSLARVFVYPSLWEGFGMPILEAMACGCPVVTSNLSSMPEVAGEAAVFVDPYSSEDVARGVAVAWEDAPLRDRLVALGRERAAQFTWARAARETVAVYEAALD